MSGYPPQYGQFQDPPGTFPAAKPSGNPFADPQNPYAAPQLGGYYQPVPQPGNLPPFAGLWRQGNVLVMHKSAPLPEICLKSNLPAKNRLSAATCRGTIRQCFSRSWCTSCCTS